MTRLNGDRSSRTLPANDKDAHDGASIDRELSLSELEAVAAAGDSKTPPDANGKKPGAPATP